MIANALLRSACALAALGALALAQGNGGSTAIGAIGSIDEFHPAHQPGPNGERPALPAPAYGGSATLHVEVLPPSLNHALDNKAIARWILREVHETLARRDPQTLEWVPGVARAWSTEDLVRVTRASAERLGVVGFGSPRANGAELALRGRATVRADGGCHIAFADGSSETLASADVVAVLPGCALTVQLRDGVRWHDGHPFDAEDAAFSVRMYSIPGVPAGELRYEFEKIELVTVLSPRELRYEFRAPYFAALDTVLEMCLLPRHLYDLGDPDNAQADPEGRKTVLGASGVVDDAARARYVAENSRNRMWVGLGPWRVVRHDDELIEARRFDGYFDPARAGYLDVVRWRYFRDDNAAFQALLAGELDFTYRVASTDYFGPACQSDAFTRTFYKGMYPAHAFGVIVWNTRRPLLSDPLVRTALAHAIDLERFKTSYYRGVAEIVTGAMSHLSPAYDATIEPLRHDPARARALLAEAGWDDHDGDGRLDRDGAAFELELVMQSGNASANAIALLLQEALRAFGGELRISAIEPKLASARVKARDFDAAPLAWIPPLEQDQEQLFHSRWAPPGLDSSNYSGFADAQVDQWIESAQRELDPAARFELWKRVQRRVYELQPLLFLYSPPRKIALNQKLRGYRVGREDPGFSVRDWYYAAGTEGTRPAR
ncbi:MAG: hypothetical protein EPO68_06230 [Planctomycetota bacterium]|nr:MAG: hypothetical protein EPO68_06230 [Planctomycetota bacterium]